MRIATGGFYHETNRFGNILVTPQVVNSRTYALENWTTHYTGVHSYSGGFIDEAKELGVEIVPAVDFHISPCGPIQQESLEMCRDQLVDLLWKAYEEKPFDAIVSTNLKKLAKLSIVLGILMNIIILSEQIMTVFIYDLPGLLISEKITHVTGMFKIDLTFLIYWAILMLLSYVFRYGESLQQLSDETL